MKKVTVIAAKGARVAGPCRIELSREQVARRQSQLGSKKTKGIFDLDGTQKLQFKQGESFGIDTPDRLNRALFSWEGDDAPEDGAEDTVAAAAGDDTVAGNAGSDTVTGGQATLPVGE